MPARIVLCTFLTALMLAAVGCTTGGGVEDNGPDVGNVADAPQSYVGTAVSVRGTPVFWTAAYATADGGAAAKADPAGWLCMVVVNPRKVTQGLLVCAHSQQPLEQVQGLTAPSVRVEGQMKTFVKTDLVRLMKEQHGVDLVTSSGGQPLYVEMASPLAGVAPSGRPPSIPPERLRALASGAPSPAASSPGAGPSTSGESRP